MDVLEPGMKVECIKRPVEGPPGYYGTEELPIVGHIYTVRDVYITYTSAAAVRLVEIKNIPLVYVSATAECGFLAEHFRPIRQRETSIEVFRDLDARVFKRVDA